MLAKRDCEVNGHPVVLECLSQIFRLPFGVPFSIFRDIVETARAWRSKAVDQERKLCDDQIDCVGIKGLPLELKVLRAFRMLAKGCSFDAIAELSGM